jgi:hypothetical protein
MEAIFIILTGILLGCLLPVPKPGGPSTDSLLAEILRRVLRLL